MFAIYPDPGHPVVPSKRFALSCRTSFPSCPPPLVITCAYFRLTKIGAPDPPWHLFLLTPVHCFNKLVPYVLRLPRTTEGRRTTLQPAKAIARTSLERRTSNHILRRCQIRLDSTTSHRPRLSKTFKNIPSHTHVLCIYSYHPYERQKARDDGRASVERFPWNGYSVNSLPDPLDEFLVSLHLAFPNCTTQPLFALTSVSQSVTCHARSCPNKRASGRRRSRHQVSGPRCRHGHTELARKLPWKS